MTPAYNKVHNSFKLNGAHFNFDTLKDVAFSFIREGFLFEKDIGEFLLCWLDNNPLIEVRTSGSTGIPKTITIAKQTMVNSAIATGNYFNLQPGDTALLCLPAQYIAGKMMLIRAIVLGLEIDAITPQSKLVINQKKKYAFAAMVPLQLEQAIDQISAFEKIIIGGIKVSSKLVLKTQKLKTNIYETYGMTETVSHIAVKKINQLNTGKIPVFETLPGVVITQDKRDCLVIKASHITKNKIITNDVITLLSKTTFEWIGRLDNVINTGGVKVFPEQIENQLHSKINSRFFIASEVDKALGQRVILVVEGDKDSVNTLAFNLLGKFMKPKRIYYLKTFVETNSGKIQRKKTLQLLKK